MDISGLNELPEVYNPAWVKNNNIPIDLVFKGFGEKQAFIENYLFNIESRKDGIDKRTVEISKREYDSLGLTEQNLYDSNKVVNVDCCGASVPMGFKNLRDYMSDVIFKRISPDDKYILDFGSGNGFNAKYISDRNKEIIITGIDISESRIENAKKWMGLRENVNFYPMDGSDLKYPDNYFDLVYSCHALEQMESVIEKAVNEIVRVTKHRAVLIEPIFENGDAAQKLYLVKYGYVLSLLSILKKHPRVKIIENINLGIQGSSLNQSSLIHIEKIN